MRLTWLRLKRSLAIVSLTTPSFIYADSITDDSRKWLSADGRTLNAKVLAIDEEEQTIDLKRSDGLEFTLEWTRLSKTDIEWIRQKIEHKKTSSSTPSPSAEATTLKTDIKDDNLSFPDADLPDRFELKNVPMITQEASYCVPASAAMIAGFHEIKTDQHEVAKLSSASSENNQGTYPSDMLRAMQKLGFDGELALWDDSDAFFSSMLPKIRQKLVEAGPIYISFKAGVFGSSGHGCVIVGYNDRQEKLSFHNPWGNQFQKSYENVSLEGRGVVYIEPPMTVPVADESFMQGIKTKLPVFVGDTATLWSRMSRENIPFAFILCSRHESNKEKRYTQNLARREGRKILELAFERNPAVIIPQNQGATTQSYYFVTRPEGGGSRFQVHEIDSEGWNDLGLKTISAIGRNWTTHFIDPNTGAVFWDLPLFELRPMK